MKKLLSILFCILSLTTSTAGVPTEMMYQVMVIHGKGTPQDITIGIKLRKGSENGTEVWSKDFVLTEVRDKSVQTLTLDFGEGVNWNDDSDFYLATFIDGEEAGVSKVTSVPYAFVALSLGGVVTKEFLVGTWKRDYYKKSYDYDSGTEKNTHHQDIFTFYEDGTCSWNKIGEKPCSYQIKNDGKTIITWTDNIDSVEESIYGIYTPVIISENEVLLPIYIGAEASDYRIFTRQRP